ncbi:MAG: translocase [Chlamydiae bacterium CG10_big_fil_rev_8_21_14_0_10_42_34]|nr:MAG: translocase [Chlamydiae bacterium CG10_big_fil_rev_8_21_14_0_10_42_34]
MASGDISPLTRWRQRLWPINAYELKKILPLLFMKFFISFTYGVLTTMKDAFVVTAKGSGAEVIPVLKGWVVLPIALGATLLYSKLANTFSRSSLFYGIILFFMSFVFLYGFVLYPNLDALSPHESADWLLSKIGQENAHWVAIYRNWIQSLFFVTAELWGSIVIFLLFWGFVNHICNFNEAKRSYNLFIAGGDLAQMFTGPLVCYFTGKYLAEEFGFALQGLVYCVLFFGVMIMALHFYVTHRVLKDERLYQPEQNQQPINQKTKLSLLESLKFIVRSPYLRYIAVMVVAYGLTVNLTEVTWKANLKLAYPETGAYQGFMATVSSSVGVCSFIITLFFSGILIRRLGWHFCAQLPPIVIGATSLVFLLLFMNQSLLGTSPLLLIVLFGAFQNITTKVMKYAFFDATKEMSYIPLDHESKVKGKAAIDVVGSRLGKSGAAWIQIVLIQVVGTGSVLSITHFLLPFIGCTVLFWILSVRQLNKEFEKKTLPSELSSNNLRQSNKAFDPIG